MEQTQQRLYILVRKDLSLAQQAVQAGHAVAAFVEYEQLAEVKMRDRWANSTLVYVTVPDEKWLRLWEERIFRSGMWYIPWFDPDLTAIAVKTTDTKIFAKLPLMT